MDILQSCNLKSMSSAELSAAEVLAITESWGQIKNDWNSKHGAGFLMKVFTTYPEITKGFPYGGLSDAEMEVNDRFKRNVVNSGYAIDGIVNSVSDADAMEAAVAKLVNQHIAMNITSMLEFNKTFECLLDYINCTTSPPEATAAAWEKATTAVIDAMTVDLKKKGK